VWLTAVPVYLQGEHNLQVSQTNLLMTVLMDSAGWSKRAVMCRLLLNDWVRTLSGSRPI